MFTGFRGPHSSGSQDSRCAPPQRPAIGYIKSSLALALVGISLVVSIQRASAATPTNASIASIANSYPNGTHAGQCWTFMHDVVLRASNGTMSIGKNNDYYGSYVAVGGRVISRDSAEPGDIIQKYNPTNHHDSKHVHTAIILGHVSGSNTFSVVDSNENYDGKVLHHSYDPWSNLPSGWAVAIWRVGTASLDGHVEVFASGPGGVVYHDWQRTPGGSTGWSGWSPLDGAGGFSSLTAARNPDGHVEVFGVGSGGVVYHDWQKSPGGGAGWSGWSPLDSKGGFSSVAAGVNPD